MLDLILLTPEYPAGFGDEVDTSVPPTFNVRFIRLRSQETVNRLISGTPRQELPNDDIEVEGEVLAPDGSPQEPMSMGSPGTGNLEDALSVVDAALQNPNSVLRQNGFGTETPIYIWRSGQAAVQVVPPGTDESE